MTTTAAPKRRIVRACRRNGSSPSLRLMELTIPFPCRHLSPASSTSNRELSTITGTRATSGSLERSVRNFVITAGPSSIPSSTLTSITLAPFSTCWRATLRASS